MITALGGGIIRDILIGACPRRRSTTGATWPWPPAAGWWLSSLGTSAGPLAGPITVLDAAGLSLFAVTGASKALDFGLGPGRP